MVIRVYRVQRTHRSLRVRQPRLQLLDKTVSQSFRVFEFHSLGLPIVVYFGTRAPTCADPSPKQERERERNKGKERAAIQGPLTIVIS